MRKLILLAVMLWNLSSAFGQMLGDEYAFKGDVRIYKWDETTQLPENDTTTDYYQAQRGNIFVIKRKISFKWGKESFSGYKIVFWHFNKDNVQVAPIATKAVGVRSPGYKVIPIDKEQNDIEFFVRDNDVKNSATSDFKRPVGLFKVDAVVLPVKLRFKNSTDGVFDLGQSISVGPAINWTHNYGGAFSETSLSLLMGANISSIPVDEKTVPTIVTSKTTLLGLSPFIGLNFEYHSVSFGIMTGIDILSGKAEDNWVYRRSPWLGFTIGTSLIAPAKKTNNSQ